MFNCTLLPVVLVFKSGCTTNQFKYRQCLLNALDYYFCFIFVWWCETATCNGPIVYHLEDRWMKVEHRWDDNWQVKIEVLEGKKKTLRISTLFTINSTFAAVELNLCLRGENLATKPPKNCAVLQCLKPWVRFEIHHIFGRSADSCVSPKYPGS